MAYLIIAGFLYSQLFFNDRDEPICPASSLAIGVMMLIASWDKANGSLQWFVITIVELEIGFFIGVHLKARKKKPTP